MSVASATSRTQYAGAGITGPYAFTFRIQSGDDLRVVRLGTDDVEYVLVEDTDYSVSGVGDESGTITLVEALAVGETLTLRRVPANTQPSSFQNQGPYFPKSIEDALDRIVMQVQALQDLVSRSPRVAESADLSLLELGLTPETGKVLAWQSSTELGNSALDSGAIAIPGAGRTVSTLTAYLLNNAVYNVKDYGALGNGIADDTAAIRAAIAAAAAKGIVYFPVGTYRTTSAIVLPISCYLVGAGRLAATINADHVGDCFQSTHTVNGSTTADITIRSLSITSAHASQVGAGFVDLAGSYITIEDCYISGFKYQIIFDQTEIGLVSRCIISHPGTTTGIWLTNGDDRTTGAGKHFTNRIVIRENQFNAVAGTGTSIVDDGGTSHLIIGNNFNDGSNALRAAGTFNLSFINNECENHSASSVRLEWESSVTNAFVGPNLAATIEGNLMSGSPYAINIAAMVGGSIRNNFLNGNTYAIHLSTYMVARVKICDNVMSPSYYFGGNSSIIDDTAAGVVIAGQDFTQRLTTYVELLVASGSHAVTPQSMGVTGTSSRIIVGSVLHVYNSDANAASTAERVVVTAVTATTFTATFANAHTANFNVILVS